MEREKPTKKKKQREEEREEKKKKIDMNSENSCCRILTEGTADHRAFLS